MSELPSEIVSYISQLEESGSKLPFMAHQLLTRLNDEKKLSVLNRVRALSLVSKRVSAYAQNTRKELRQEKSTFTRKQQLSSFFDMIEQELAGSYVNFIREAIKSQHVDIELFRDGLTYAFEHLLNLQTWHHQIYMPLPKHVWLNLNQCLRFMVGSHQQPQIPVLSPAIETRLLDQYQWALLMDTAPLGSFNAKILDQVIYCLPKWASKVDLHFQPTMRDPFVIFWFQDLGPKAQEYCLEHPHQEQNWITFNLNVLHAFLKKQYDNPDFSLPKGVLNTLLERWEEPYPHKAVLPPYNRLYTLSKEMKPVSWTCLRLSKDGCCLGSQDEDAHLRFKKEEKIKIYRESPTEQALAWQEGFVQWIYCAKSSHEYQIGVRFEESESLQYRR